MRWPPFGPAIARSRGVPPSAGTNHYSTALRHKRSNYRYGQPARNPDRPCHTARPGWDAQSCTCRMEELAYLQNCNLQSRRRDVTSLSTEPEIAHANPPGSRPKPRRASHLQLVFCSRQLVGCRTRSARVPTMLRQPAPTMLRQPDLCITSYAPYLFPPGTWSGASLTVCKKVRRRVVTHWFNGIDCPRPHPVRADGERCVAPAMIVDLLSTPQGGPGSMSFRRVRIRMGA